MATFIPGCTVEGGCIAFEQHLDGIKDYDASVTAENMIPRACAKLGTCSLIPEVEPQNA